MSTPFPLLQPQHTLLACFFSNAFTTETTDPHLKKNKFKSATVVDLKYFKGKNHDMVLASLLLEVHFWCRFSVWVPGTNLKAGSVYEPHSICQNYFTAPRFNMQKWILCHGYES